MKIYSNKFELRTPTDRRYYAAPNSIFAFGVKATLDGEDAEGTIKVFQGSTELTPMEATVDGFKLYQRTSGSNMAVNEFDVVYTKDSKVQHFKLIETITNSTVFDIDQEGGAFELPIASSTILGGIKVGQNLTIDADGTLNAQGGGSSGGPRMIIVNKLNTDFGPPLAEIDDVQDCDVLIFPGGDPSPYGNINGIHINNGPYAGNWAFSSGYSKYYTFVGGSQIILTIDATSPANYALQYNVIGFSAGQAKHEYDYLIKQ